MLAKGIPVSGSLGRRIFFLFAGVSMGVFLLVNLIWLPSVIKDIRQEQAELRLVSVQLIRDQVKQYLDEKQAALKITAQRFRASLFEGKADKEGLLLTTHRLFQSDPAFEEIGILDETGKEIFRYSRRSAINEKDFVDRSTSSLFREGMKQQISWESVMLNETSEPLGVFSIRLPGSDPFLKGLVFGVVNLRSLWNLAGEFKLSNGGRIYIVDENGKLIAAADPSEVFRQLSFADRPFIQQLIDSKMSDKHSFVEGDYINERGVKTLATGLLLKKPKWAVVIEQPKSILFIPIRKKILFFAGLSFLGLVLSFALAQMLSRHLIRPIISLREGVQEIGGGNLGYKVSVETDDEIGELARQFNHMAERLHSAQEATLSALTIPVISQASEIQQVLSEVLTNVIRVTSAEAASIRLLDDKKEEFVISVYQGFSKSYSSEQQNVASEDGWKKILSTTDVLVSKDILNESDRNDVILAREGFGSAVYLPLRNPQKTFGIMMLAKRKPDRLSANQTNLISTIAHEITVALENVSLYQEAVISREELEKINRVLTKQTAELASTNAAIQIEMTERKRAEEERQAISERLQRSEKMEALGQLAGGVAHDLNNVLGVLSGYSELLLEKIPAGNPLRKYAENILKSTEKGAAIINDLLTLARRGVAVTEVVDVNCTVSNLLVTPEFDRLRDYHSGVTITTDLEKDLLNIKGSPIHLEKTVFNLVSNAAEAITGRGKVNIRTENRYLDRAVQGYDTVREGDYVVLMVSDTGGGIPAADMEKIFEPFYTKKSMGRSGTGLGLAIVWGTVKDHEGYIDVQSSEGNGSTFTLYFPVTRETKGEEGHKVPIEEYLGHGESVLVVDDVQEQRDVATAILLQLGYQVASASSGKEAIGYLKSNKADILVLDMIMQPGIDGLETYKRVLEIKPHQKAIIVSGFSETDRVKETQRLGAGAYVKKPYAKEKIGVAIRDELLKVSNSIHSITL